MEGLNIDILALILSHIEPSDIKHCILVNKKFLRAILTKQHFWIHQSQRFILDYAKEIKLPTEYYPLLNYFDPFFLKNESLKSQMSWLFHGGFFVMDFNKKGITICKRHENSKWVRFSIRPENYVISIYVHDFYRIFNGTVERIHKNGSKFVVSLVGGKVVSVKGIRDGVHWDGDVIIIKGNFVPHGEGVWTFEDGRTLRGAINGKPIL